MTVRLENLTSRLVTLMLNSGAVVHLPPGHCFEPESVEIEANPQVQRLCDATVIAVTRPEAEAADAEPADEHEAEADRQAKPRRGRRQPAPDNEQ
ncbi:hypothetical protein ACIBG8_42905 [Nonomuraea sp. NPDC050556]|uniref:hypothetical protein n=1 Tax=Nonomuraea sp. NPDC050556 TaxID=3364369 RepID=UPI0037A59A04